MLQRIRPVTTAPEFPKVSADDEDSRGAQGLGHQDLTLLGLLADGMVMEAVGRRMELSDRTVRRRARAICDQLGVRSPVQAIVWAARRGLI